MAVRIRDARSEDAEALSRLLGHLGYPADKQQTAKRLCRIEQDPDTRLFVATVDAAVVGAAMTDVIRPLEHDRPACVMMALVVDEEHRRHGIGRLLADAVEAEARSRGCFEVVLSSARRRKDAHAFYRRMGYAHTGRRYIKTLE